MTNSTINPEDNSKEKKNFYIYFFHNGNPYLVPERHRISRERLKAGLIFEEVQKQFLFDKHL